MRWGEKRYHQLNWFLKNKFGKRCVKLPIDAGFTCPNRDGTKGYGGCIFCSARGSGDFTASGTIDQQLELGQKAAYEKWGDCVLIAYFQAFTNTYAPPDQLEYKYRQALANKDVKALAIATRPDCLDYKTMKLLERLNKETYLWVELGLQTSNEASAAFINRGYSNQVFTQAVNNLKNAGIDTVVHTILGLPHETSQDRLETIDFVSSHGVQGIKLQLLHVLKQTPLAQLYHEKQFQIMEQEAYVEAVIQAMEHLPQSVVIHRLTGDGAKKDLIAPLWSLQKRSVLNAIEKSMKEKNSYQGKAYLG